MAALTEESLNKLNKPDLVALVVNLKSKMDSVNSDLVAELRKMREGFDQMKSDLSVTKKVNTLLSERLKKSIAGQMPSIPGESALRSLASHHQSVTMILKTLFAKQ